MKANSARKKKRKAVEKVSECNHSTMPGSAGKIFISS